MSTAGEIDATTLSRLRSQLRAPRQRPPRRHERHHPFALSGRKLSGVRETGPTPYFPKGTDFATVTEAELDAVADELDDRPRKRLDFAKPTEQLAELLLH
jgi:hypothetical protein